MKTLYVTDLDGTLLDNDSRVSLTSARLLSELAHRGVMFTPATARTPATVQPLLSGVAQSQYVDDKGLRCPLPAIVMTGSALWNRVERRFESCELIPEADALAIKKVFDEIGLMPFVYCLGDGGFLNVYHPKAMNRREDSFYQERRHLELKRFHLDQQPKSWDSVALFFTLGPVDMVKRASEQLQSCTECAAAWYPDVIIPETGLIDIYAPGVSKAHAVSELARKVGADEVVVFGDNLNDLPMMRVATHAVAVENALPEVKTAADEVIGLNSADAVARYIAVREGYEPDELIRR